jgi:predicted transcriptional regulator
MFLTGIKAFTWIFIGSVFYKISGAGLERHSQLVANIYIKFLQLLNNMHKTHGNSFQSRTLKVIHNNWPVHVREVARHLGLDPHDISNVSKIRYHFKSLERQEKIRTKKIGRALVAWPTEIEKLRLIHELLREV